MQMPVTSAIANLFLKYGMDPYANQKDLCRSRKFVMLIFRLHDAGQWECKETGS